MRGVFIPDRDARAVAYVLERGLSVIVGTDAVRPPAALYALLAELRAASSALIGTGGIPTGTAPVMVPSMSALAAADLLRVSDRAVRALATRGTLPGRQARRGAPWKFWPELRNVGADRERLDVAGRPRLRRHGSGRLLRERREVERARSSAPAVRWPQSVSGPPWFTRPPGTGRRHGQLPAQLGGRTASVRLVG